MPSYECCNEIIEPFNFVIPLITMLIQVDSGYGTRQMPVSTISGLLFSPLLKALQCN